MGAAPGGTSQGYAAASDDPFPNSSSFEFPSLEPLFDDWESLRRHLGSNFSNDSQYCVEDLYYGSSHGSHALLNSSITCTPAAQSDCKLQPRVYSRSSSIAHTYTPPPCGQVVELQCLPPPQLLPNDMVPPLNDLTLGADGIDHIIKPCHPLHSSADMSYTPHVGAFNKPLPASFSHNSYQFDADTNAGRCQGKQHDNFSFSISHVEAKHQDQLPDYTKLTSSPNNSPLSHQSALRNSMKLRIPVLDVSTSHTAWGTMSDIASPACMQNITFSPVANSDSAVMETSSTYSAPGAMVTSNSSFFQTSMPPESGSLPASPTPSVNKGAKTRRSLCHRETSAVGFMVETTSLNENDGFKWKKYGEKEIKGSNFSRSYYKCDASNRCGCKILKRVQQSDHNHVLYTYWGRHNHP